MSAPDFTLIVAFHNPLYVKLHIRSEKLLICGEISGQTYLLCDDIEYIDTQTYEDYLKGMYSVTLNANGGTVSEELITAYYGSAIGNLPTPTLDYYTFEGWFTAEDGGDSVTSASTFTNDTVLYAHWTLNAESGWVLSSAVPSDAQVVDTKWSYDLTTTTESTATSLSGYTQYGSYWSQSGSGSRYYATFPSGFDTSNTIYKTFSSSAYSASETSTAKRTVSNSSAGYVYWHWMYDCGSSTAGDRAILSYKGTGPDNGYYYDNFGAFTSSTSYTSTGGAYYCNSISGLVTYYNTGRTTYADSQGSKYWFRFSYSKSSYTDYEKIFQYTKTESKESSTEISASSTISNVQKWVTYRTI